MSSIYEIRETQLGDMFGSLIDCRFDRREEAVAAAIRLDGEGWNCEVFAIDATTGRVTGCVYGERTWGWWND
jgi:hypothetical protein